MLELSDCTLRIDNYAISQWLTCRRKFWFRIIDGLVPNTPNGTARGFGASIHEALRVWYDPATCATDDKERFALTCNAFYAEWAKTGVEDAMRNTKVAESVLRQYCAKWSLEWFDPIHVEVGFAMPLTSDIIYEGRMDLIARDRASDKLIVVDHKTSARKPGSVMQEIKARQMSGYVWAAQQLSDVGVLCNSAIYNYVIITTQPQYERILTTRTREQLAEWVDATIRIVNEIRVANTFEDCYCNQEMCNMYSRCDYLELCNCPNGSRAALIAHKFTRKPWSAFEQGLIFSEEK